MKKYKVAPFICEQRTLMGGKGLCERIDGLSRDDGCVREEINLHRDVFMAIWSECLLMKKTE